VYFGCLSGAPFVAKAEQNDESRRKTGVLRAAKFEGGAEHVAEREVQRTTEMGAVESQASPPSLHAEGQPRLSVGNKSIAREVGEIWFPAKTRVVELVAFANQNMPSSKATILFKNSNETTERINIAFWTYFLERINIAC
jgi:hypothetical protein